MNYNTVNLDGKKLEKYLVDNGLSKLGVSLGLGHSNSYLNDVVRNNRTSRSAYKHLCSYLGVDEEMFLVKKEEPKKEVAKEPETDIGCAEVYVELKNIEKQLVKQNELLEKLLDRIETRYKVRNPYQK